MDRISDLPDDVLHRVMSFLGGGAEVARTRVLSRRWRRLAESFPALDFLQPSHVRTLHTPLYRAQYRRFTAHVHRELAKFLSSNLGNSLTRFRFETAFDDPELPSLLDKWIAAIMKVGVGEISLSIDHDRDKRLFYFLPETTFVRAPAMDGVCPKVHSLRKLFLGHVFVTEKVIEDIARNCPEIHEIFLFQCRGFVNLVINDHRKLEIVKVIRPEGTGGRHKLEGVKIDAKNLRVFCLEHLLLNQICEVSLASCLDLRELTLTNGSLPGEWFQQNLPRFSLLEDLVISNCHNAKDVRVSSRRLRSLRIHGRINDIERIEIDAPNLSMFRSHSSKIPVFLVKNVQCVLDMSFSFDECMINTSWFLKFREFLAASEQRKTLELDFFLSRVITFDLQELEEAIIPHPFEVENLELNLGMDMLYTSGGALINGLLWSCHPKRISFKRYSVVQEMLVEVIGKKLFNKDNFSCCNSHVHDVINCWRNDLKSVKIVIISGSEEREVHTHNWENISAKLPPEGTGCKLAYKLEWLEP